MAKRYRDSELYGEAWYRKLKPVYKCAWDFLCAKCDVAGMWSIDLDAIYFFVGEKFDLNDFLTSVNDGKKRIERYNSDKLFITGFVDFQYGRLSESCKPHVKIIELLRKYGLLDRVYKGYTKGTETLEYKEQYKEEEKEEDNKGGVGENWPVKPTEHFELNEMENTLTIEFIHRIKQKLLTSSEINTYWKAFTIQYFTGEKFYKSRVECISHFRNWLKDQKHENNQRNNQQSGGAGSRSDSKLNKIQNLGRKQAS